MDNEHGYMYWNKRLNPLLEGGGGEEPKAPRMIIGRDRYYHNEELDEDVKSMEFCQFQNYVEVYKHIMASHPDSRHFYEVIYGPQKPHFDIDMEVVRLVNPLHENPLRFGDEYRELLIGDRESFVSKLFLPVICQAIYDMFIKLHPTGLDAERQFVITDSSTVDKLSFHIVLDGVFHRSCQESRVLYDAVVAHIATTNKNFDPSVVDSAVYKRNQQFRTLWSRKIDKRNTKMYYRGAAVEILSSQNIPLRLGTRDFLREYEGEGGVCTPLEVFARSLVSNTVACTGLRNARMEGHPTGGKPGGGGGCKIAKPKLEEEVSTRAWECFKACPHYLTKEGGKPMFRMRQVNGNRIILQKTSSYICPVCNRKHETENPFLEVKDDGGVWFVCRRALDNKDRRVSIPI